MLGEQCSVHTYIRIYSVVSPVLLHKAGDVGC